MDTKWPFRKPIHHYIHEKKPKQIKYLHIDDNSSLWILFYFNSKNLHLQRIKKHTCYKIKFLTGFQTSCVINEIKLHTLLVLGILHLQWWNRLARNCLSETLGSTSPRTTRRSSSGLSLTFEKEELNNNEKIIQFQKWDSEWSFKSKIIEIFGLKEYIISNKTNNWNLINVVWKLF